MNDGRTLQEYMGEDGHWFIEDISSLLCELFSWDAPQIERVTLMRVGYAFRLKPSQWVPPKPKRKHPLDFL